VANGQQDIENLEFQREYDAMTPDKREWWMANKMFYLTCTVSKLSSTQDNITDRLLVIENNCKQAVCGQGVDNSTPRGKVPQSLKYGAYGVGGTVSVGTIIYWIFELIKAWRG
jgi:hypothetical protein